MLIVTGKIVGVIVHNGVASSESKELLNVMTASRPSTRWLEETEMLPNSTAIAEAILVRRTVAWTTGLVLIIATLLGVSFSSTTSVGFLSVSVRSVKLKRFGGDQVLKYNSHSVATSLIRLTLG